jgi:SGNH domain-containing protein
VLSSPRGSALDPKSVIHRDSRTVQVRDSLAPVPRGGLAALTTPIDERLERIAAAIGASVIDPTAWLCTPSLCPSVDERGRPLYKDESHLRERGAGALPRGRPLCVHAMKREARRG